MPEFMWYVIGAIGVAGAAYFLMIIGLVLRIALGKDKR